MTSRREVHSEVLGCRHMGSNERYSFMRRGGSYFVLAKIPHTLLPSYTS
jgi:hypothetical protein